MFGPFGLIFPIVFCVKQNFSAKFCSSVVFFLILAKFHCAKFQKKKKKKKNIYIYIKCIPSNTGFRLTQARTVKYEFIGPFQLKLGI